MRLCGLGDNIVDIYPEQGVVYPGGSACNVAVHAARLGAFSSYVGVLGRDFAGRLIHDSLESEGVDLRRVRWADAPNSTVVVHVDDSGNREFTDYHPPTTAPILSPEDLAFLGGMDAVHTGHVSLVEDQLATIADVAPVSFDFSYRDWDYAEPLLPYVTYATFSRPLDSDQDCRALLRAVRDAGVPTGVVTRGDRGSMALLDGYEIHEQKAIPAHVVDTLGAGDAFTAQLLVALSEGLEAPRAFERAAEYATRACASLGAFGHEASISSLVAEGRTP